MVSRGYSIRMLATDDLTLEITPDGIADAQGEEAPDEGANGEGAGAEPSSEAPEASDDTLNESTEPSNSQTDTENTASTESEPPGDTDGGGEPKVAEFPPIEPEDGNTTDKNADAGDATVRSMDREEATPEMAD